MTSSIETADGWPVYPPFAKEAYGCGKREGKKEGRREGHAKAILVVLDARDVDVNDAERTWIVACANRKQLKIWLRRAVTAEKTSDLFD